MNILVSTALLVLLTWCAKISAVHGRRPFPCDFSAYRNKTTGACTLCDKCRVGEQLTQNCGHDRSGNLVGTKCEPCGPGKFQDQPSTTRCHSCKTKCSGGRRMTQPCTKTSDIFCTCMTGWYEENGTCQRCTRCCADNYEHSDYYNQKCGNDRMGKCSCRRHDSCEIKQCTAANETSSPATPSPTPTFNPSTQETVPTTTVLPKGNVEAVTGTEQAYVSSWWIFAIVTFAIVLIIIILVIIAWHCQKCINYGLPSQDNNHSSPNSVQRHCPPVWIHDSDIENKAKPMEPPSGSCSAETPDKEIVCSCLLERGQQENKLGTESSSTKSIKSPGEVSNKDDNTRAGIESSEVEPLLEKTTEHKNVETSTIPVVAQTAASTSKMTAGCEIRSGVADGANVDHATCIEQDDDIRVVDKMQGGLPIPETKVTPRPVPKIVLSSSLGRDFQMDPQCSCEVVAYTTQEAEWENYERKMASGHSDQVGTHVNCPYRPLEDRERHSCSECKPRPSDSLWGILGRHCLREELCNELNQNNDWKSILVCTRQEKSIKTLEDKEDPASGTLDTLRKVQPDLTLETFFYILEKVERADLKQIITQHHMKCGLCQKNPFDSVSRGSS